MTATFSTSGDYFNVQNVFFKSEPTHSKGHLYIIMKDIAATSLYEFC